MSQKRKFEDERVFMNTTIKITVLGSKGTIHTRNKIETAFAQFDEVVTKFTRFKPTSELSKLNSAHGKSFKVTPELFRLIRFAMELASVSFGAFDPTIIDLLEAFGFDGNNDYNVLDEDDLYSRIKTKAESRASFDEIKLNEPELLVRLAPEQRIDLGSIGKGYAIDLAANVLDEFEDFSINAGGDIRVKGDNPQGKPWRVGLGLTPRPNQKPDGRQILGTVELKNSALAGSGGWVRRVKFFHHLLNPKTGFPINEVSQTFVLADTAMRADGWATLLYVMGVDALKLISREPNLEGLLVTASGELHSTSNFCYA